jgi:trehalose 6-phosphate synthase/phosphatase
MDHNYPSEFSDLQGSTTQEILASARAIVAQLEADHRAKGTKLSGRIIHLTHYLPITVTLKPKDSTNGESGAPISPPKTPVADIVGLEAEKAHKTGEISLFDIYFYPPCPPILIWA